MSAVWKHLKLSQKDVKIITNTDSERLFISAWHVFDENNNNSNSSINTFIIIFTQVFKLRSVIFSGLKEVSSAQQGDIYVYSKKYKNINIVKYY